MPLWNEPLVQTIYRTVADHQTGPDWLAYLVIGILAILSVVLLSGHGVNLIAGYNTASASEKQKYDAKRLCRVMGGGMCLITVSMFLLFYFQDRLSDWWIGFQVQFVFVIVIAMIVLANTWCKKKEK